MSSKSSEIRFNGYTDDWEQRKLGDVVRNIGTGKSKFKISKESSYTNYAVLGSTSIIGFDTDYDYEGNFILTARVGANAGTLYQYSGKVKITDNTVYIQGDNLSFLYSLLNNFNLKKLSFGTGQPLIKSSELKKITLKFPDKEEQIKIGSFFKQLDDTITLHQRELDNLIKSKKGFLQKMFPKKDERTPSFRFNGFSEDWKEKQLGEISNIVKGSQKNKSSLSNIRTSDYCYPVYNGGIDVSGYTDEYNRDSLISISEGGASAGYVNYIDEKFWSGGHNYTLDVYDVYNDVFLKSYLDSQQDQLLRLKVGSGLPNVQKSALSTFSVFIPLLDEQQKIGVFFKYFDKMIAEQKFLVSSYQQMKKAFLQKMFV